MKASTQSSIARVAQFVAGVGEGNTFTKLQLTAAVPGFAQTPRRMRDLREMGWKIDHYKSNSSLRPEQYLLRTIGTRIDLGEPRPVAVRKSITGPKRRRILERDGHTCQCCGVPAGVEHPDAPGTQAILTIGHIIPVSRGGNDDEANLRAECTVCGDQARDITINPPEAQQVFALVQAVKGREEKKRLHEWMSMGRRTLNGTETAYNEWARLPQVQRDEIRTELGRQLGIVGTA
jgi:hypothetical protein